MTHRLLGLLSTAMIAVGTVLLVFFAYHLATNSAGRRDGIDAFEQARAARAMGAGEGRWVVVASSTPLEETGREAALVEPDTREWSASRIAAYASAESIAASAEVPEGLVRIPSVSLELPVFTGTSEPALTLGAGRIEGTPPLGAPGNTGIAAHRDGWFRALKDVQIGDIVEVETLDDERSYRVTELFVVEPEDVHVLAPTERDSLTLVTCYPFYFVGSAPQRYIVRAERIGPAGDH
jgi:sortase A